MKIIMKRNLLSPISSLTNSFQPQSFGFLIPLIFVFCIGFSSRTKAQCTGYNYQVFESFKATMPKTAGVPNGFVQGVDTPGNNWTATTSTSSSGANPRSGSNSLFFGTANTDYIITPKIRNLKIFSFYFRGPNTNSGGFTVEWSTNYNGLIANVGTATWTPVLTTFPSYTLATQTGVTSTTYTLASFDLSTINNGGTIASNAGIYIRIRDNRLAGTGQIRIDDIAWTSTNDADNTLVVLPLQTVAGATSCTTVAMPSNGVYTFTDNGGLSDNYNNNVLQDHTVTFTPFPGQRIQMIFANPVPPNIPTGRSFDTNGTVTGTATMTISGTNNNVTLANYPASQAPTTIYSSSDACTGITTVRFTTSAGTVGNGFAMTVSSVPPASCPDVVNLGITTSNITFSTVPLTWNPLSGCGAPSNGYDYYASTSSSPSLPIGVSTPTTTPSLVANTEPSGTSAGAIINGLTGGTVYYIWVRSNCGGTYGTWTQIPGSFIRTVCAPQPVTYTENFQSGGLPTCTSTGGSSSFGITNNAGNFYFSTSQVGISFYTQPVTLVGGTTYRLSYDYGNSANATSVFQIFYGSTNFAATTSNINTSLTSVTATSNTFTTGRYYFTPPTSGIYYIRFALNSNTGGVLNLDNIEIRDVPCFAAVPTNLNGPPNPCAASSVTYYIDAPATTTSGATSLTPDSYTVIPPPGWVVTDITGNGVTVTTGAIPGDFIITSNRAGCDSSLPVKFSKTTSVPPALPSVITGPTTVCTALPTANLTYSVTNVPGTDYNWVFPSGWTQTPGGSSNSVTFTATASAVSGTITVTPVNGGCNGTPRTLNVVVGSVSNSVCSVNPVTITSTASDTFRCGTRHFWYRFVPPCDGNFKVNLSGTGGDIDVYVYSSANYTCANNNSAPLNTNLLISGITASATESVNLNNLVTTNTYYILVYDFSNGNGRTFNLSALSTSLSTIGAITGTSSVSCSSVTTTDYTVPAVTGATNYTWTLPAGWLGSSSTNTITVTTSGTTGGTISVVASNSCGTTLPATKLITVGQIQPEFTNVTPEITNLCSPFSATTYTVSPVQGATSYIWTLPPGWSGTSSTETISVTPNATSGSISVAASGPCGVSPATTLAVTTTAAVVTTNAAVCTNGVGFLTSTVSGVTTFAMANIPAGTSNTFVRPNQVNQGSSFSSSGTTVVYTTVAIVPLVSGDYTFNGCDSSGRDTFMSIYQTSFNPASPSTNFIASNDDSGSTPTCNVDPRLTITGMVAGQTYIIVYSGFFNVATIPSISGITITVTPPSGGSVQVGTTDWYTSATGGTPISQGNSFNPAGWPGSGIADTSSASIGVYTFYATNSLASFCRTPTTFTISDAPTQNVTPASGAICPESVIAVNSGRTGSGVNTIWTTTVPGTLFTDALGTIPYTGTNLAVVYVKTITAVTITVTSSVGTCSVTDNVTYTVSGYKIWDGFDWSPSGTPTLNDALIIDGHYTAAPGETLLGCSCRVDSGNVEFVANSGLTLTNELTNSGGTILFRSGSALLQTNDAVNSGDITYQRDSTPCFKFDYTYWSSPVASQTLIGLSPDTSSSWFFDYNPTISFWQLSNNTLPMTIGKGYLIRVPNYFPVSPALPQNFTASFVGVPNNGTIPLTVVHNPPSELNLIGNPYPSALDVNLLITDPGFLVNNTILGGTIYLWSHNTAFNPVTNSYLGTDYAVRNVLGGTATAPNTGQGNQAPPTNSIASGQGFFIKTVASGTAYFRNSMRLGAANNTNFYRSATNSNVASAAGSDSQWEKHRIWLDISNGNSAFKQLLVGYVQDGTDGLDRLFDGEMVDASNPITFYTTVENTKLSIQGRGLTFTENDTFPLGYKSLSADSYTIQLSNFDGLFTTQNVYLEDTLLNVIHDLKSGDYSFSTAAGTFENRFVVRFTTTALGVPTFSENTVVVYRNDGGLYVDSGAIPMRSVVIYDVMGRLISSQKDINATQTKFTTLPSTNQVLLVQITAETGEKVTKKVVY